ncbi:MAG: hypothetical protein WCS85_03230 [Candidatus Peribacteraceae bacterium]
MESIQESLAARNAFNPKNEGVDANMKAELTSEDTHKIDSLLHENHLEQYRKGFLHCVTIAKNNNHPLNISTVLPNTEHPPALQEHVSKVLDSVSRDILHRGDWPLPRLESLLPSEISRYSDVRICIHPLYSFADLDEEDNMKYWKQSQGNIHRYIESKLVDIAARATAAIQADPDLLPQAYMYLMDTVQELDALAAHDTSSLRIYVMPRRSLSHPEEQKIMDAMLHSFGNTSAVVTDSIETDQGRLKPDTVELLRNTLRPHANVSIQGGYLLKCLDGCASTLADTKRHDVQFSINFNDSTYAFGATNADVRTMPDDRIRVALGKNAPRIAPPKEELRDLTSIREWVKSNITFNEYYRKSMMNQYKHSQRDRFQEDPEKYHDPNFIKVVWNDSPGTEAAHA